jgi:type 1 glutamine amidotransferase
MIGWVKTYGNARVFFMQSGHDHTAYDNPTYRTLVVRAIRWAAKKLP